jgi:hypothetical protein
MIKAQQLTSHENRAKMIGETSANTESGDKPMLLCIFTGSPQKQCTARVKPENASRPSATLVHVDDIDAHRSGESGWGGMGRLPSSSEPSASMGFSE